MSRPRPTRRNVNEIIGENWIHSPVREVTTWKKAGRSLPRFGELTSRPVAEFDCRRPYALNAVVPQLDWGIGGHATQNPLEVFICVRKKA
jgi:hypothetical protein